ncbi:MAG TPA: DUF3866 family protein [Candidatus Aquicultor sp.]|jgi:hypothetical protein
MITFRTGTVTEIIRTRPGYAEVVVDIEGLKAKAICYTSLLGDINSGDEVVVNTTAVDLDLGTGGYHFVVWNLAKESLVSGTGGHIMKLRYTPMQLKCRAAEEESSPYYNALKQVVSIDEMPVIIGTLHSQLPAAAAVLKELRPELKVAYIMTDGAALPLALSNIVAELKQSRLIDMTITAGHAFGGDIEAINIYSALAAARHAARADVAIVAMGPGIVGSNTRLGFTGIEQGQIINAVNSLKGRAVAIPRISFQDMRERHYGISHHTITALTLAAMSPSAVTIPTMTGEREVTIQRQLSESGLEPLHRVERIDAGLTLDILKKRGLAPTTMGRTVEDEPEFFMAAGAAAIYAAGIAEDDNGR